MWSLGLIFWEVLVGEPLFGQNYTEEEVGWLFERGVLTESVLGDGHAIGNASTSV